MTDAAQKGKRGVPPSEIGGCRNEKEEECGEAAADYWDQKTWLDFAPATKHKGTSSLERLLTCLVPGGTSTGTAVDISPDWSTLINSCRRKGPG